LRRRSLPSVTCCSSADDGSEASDCHRGRENKLKDNCDVHDDEQQKSSSSAELGGGIEEVVVLDEEQEQQQEDDMDD